MHPITLVKVSCFFGQDSMMRICVPKHFHNGLFSGAIDLADQVPRSFFLYFYSIQTPGCPGNNQARTTGRTLGHIHEWVWVHDNLSLPDKENISILACIFHQNSGSFAKSPIRNHPMKACHADHIVIDPPW